MDSSAFGEYEICADKPGVTEDGQRRKECRRTPPRQLPQEPMSLVMNTAIGTCDGWWKAAVMAAPQLASLASRGGLSRLQAALRARDAPLRRTGPKERLWCGREARPKPPTLRRPSPRRGSLLRAGRGRHQAPQPDARRGLGRARAAMRLGHRHLLLRILAPAAAAACPKCPCCSPPGAAYTFTRPPTAPEARSPPARSGRPPAPERSAPAACAPGRGCDGALAPARSRRSRSRRSRCLLPSRLEVGGYCCAALGAASLAGTYSCGEEPPRHRGAFGGAPAFRSGGAALAELWPRSTSRGWHNEAGAQRALLSPDDDEACGVELEARSSRSPRAAYG